MAPDERSRPRPHWVLGTAGHIDHGKTALVAALTGIDTDRLPEEKARGITIDLGFAPLDLDEETRISVVDVPGHERLIRNMVAGATGIDFVLLAVAADEGVMPQTREHLAVCTLLGIRRGVVALTKMDLVDDEMAELAEEEVRDLLAGGPLEGAPIVRVSCRDGSGIERLRDEIRTLAASQDVGIDRGDVPRLWVDRSFSVRGFGSVVTGTLAGGALETGAAVVLEPSGQRGRIRGLESHGAAVERALPGTRTAVNLQGIERGDAARGELLTLADRVAVTESFDAELHWLDAAPPLEGRTSVELLVGTAERRARVIPLGAPDLAPGARGFARVHVEGAPLPVLPGDHFVLQGFAQTAEGGSTLGGGRVLDPAPPRRRPSDPALVRDLAVLAEMEPSRSLGVRVARAGLAGLPRAAVARETGIAPARLDEALHPLPAGEVIDVGGDLLMSGEALGVLCDRAAQALAAFHRDEPLQPGLGRAALAGRLPENVPAAAIAHAIALLETRGTVVLEGERIRLASHQATLSEQQKRLADALRSSLREAALEPPSPKEWSERLGADATAVRAVLAHLVREGQAVSAPGDWFFDPDAVDALRERVRDHLKAHGELETPAYKELIGTTRKHAVPLMELFDDERLTLRVGNKRQLRGAGRGSGAA